MLNFQRIIFFNKLQSFFFYFLSLVKEETAYHGGGVQKYRINFKSVLFCIVL